MNDTERILICVTVCPSELHELSNIKSLSLLSPAVLDGIMPALFSSLSSSKKWEIVCETIKEDDSQGHTVFIILFLFYLIEEFIN